MVFLLAIGPRGRYNESYGTGLSRSVPRQGDLVPFVDLFHRSAWASEGVICAVSSDPWSRKRNNETMQAAQQGLERRFFCAVCAAAVSVRPDGRTGPDEPQYLRGYPVRGCGPLPAGKGVIFLLSIHKTIDGKMTKLDTIQDGCWVNLTYPSEDELNTVAATLGRGAHLPPGGSG